MKRGVVGVFSLADALWTWFIGGSAGVTGLTEAITIHDIPTFDDWGVENGAYVVQLALYMQVVETMREMGLDLDDWDDQELRYAIDAMCMPDKCTQQALRTAGKISVYVPGGTSAYGWDMHETSTHIYEVLADFSVDTQYSSSWHFPRHVTEGPDLVDAGIFRRDWYNATDPFEIESGRLNPCWPRDREPRAFVCDEFPFFSTDQAVDLSGTMASLRPVAPHEGHAQGNDLQGFVRTCGVEEQEMYVVLPPPKSYIDNALPSVGFNVTYAPIPAVVPCYTPAVVGR